METRAEPPILRVSIENEPSTLDWQEARSATDRFLVSFIMRGLLKYDAAGKPVCDLCREYSVSKDARTYTFQLDPKAKWSDDAAVEAQQFVDSFRRLLDPANSFASAEPFRIINGAGNGVGAAGGARAKFVAANLQVKAISKSTLEIGLSQPSNEFTHLLTQPAAYPVRKEFTPSAEKDSGVAMATQATLGPYFLGAWEHGKRLVIEGNPAFPIGRPVYRVEFILGTHADLIAQFEKERIDILSNPTTEDMLKFRTRKIQVSPYWATRNLVFNFQRPASADASVRKAILHALDRDSLPGFLKNGDRRATGVIPPGMAGHRKLPLVTADAGIAKSERDRASATGKKQIELELLIRDTDVDKKVAEWLSQTLGKVSIKVVPKPRKVKAYYQDLERGQFDLALMVWMFNAATPTDLLRSFRTGDPQNIGGWTNVAFDALLGQLQAENLPLQREKILDQLTQILEVQQVAAIPLGYPTNPFLLGRRVNSFAMTPFGDPDLVKTELKK
ncbi:MAG: peptide ABC transporter substrate-binding protein [Bacteriovoracia bacterium]